MAKKSIKILEVALLLLGVVIVVQPAALADVSMTLTAPTASSTDYLFGIYLSPYTATINNGVSSVSMSVVCDDFADETFMSESWNATVYNGSSSDLSGTQMASRSGLASPTPTDQSTLDMDYEEIGWLVTQLSAANSLLEQAAISYAIWDIFEPGPVKTWLTVNYGTVTQDNVTGGKFYADGVDTNGVTYWVTHAGLAAAAGDFNLSNLTIYSPDTTTSTSLDANVNGTPCSSSNTACSDTPPQEFVTTPEASAPIMLAFDLLALFGVVSLVRRRVLRNAGVPR